MKESKQDEIGLGKGGLKRRWYLQQEGGKGAWSREKERA